MACDAPNLEGAGVVDDEVVPVALPVFRVGDGEGLGRSIVWRHLVDARKANAGVEPVSRETKKKARRREVRRGAAQETFETLLLLPMLRWGVKPSTFVSDRILAH